MVGSRNEVGRVGALAEPLRRALYEYVVRQPEAVSREQVARGLDVPVHSAKFHLDKLAAAGLLEVEFRRLSGRSGPGAGRPAKLYRRGAEEVSFSVPPRQYDLAAEVMAEAIDRAGRGDAPVADIVPLVAREAGRALVDDSAGVAAETDGDAMERVRVVLERTGYEPEPHDGELRLVNCPFDRLAAQHLGLVCGMNRSLVSGVLDALGTGGLAAVLAPEPGYCCVRVLPAERR